MNENYITCKSVRFYSQKDEDAFFEWIKRIKCIKSFEGAREYLYLDLVDKKLGRDDIRELIALLRRYKIDIKQLQKFLNEDNKNAF